MPKVSVLLPIKNGAAYLTAALESVFGQTFKEFEVVAVNDHSTDDTGNILAHIRDPRLRVINMGDEKGLVAALNIGLSHAKGDFIARMDADDICAPGRFENQLEAFRRSPGAGVAYGNAVCFTTIPGDAGARTIRSPSPSVLPDVLRLMRPGPTIVHPTVMMRKRELQAVGGYRHFLYAEDRDLWLRLTERTGFLQITQPLLHYRLNAEGVSRQNRAIQTASRVLAVMCHEFLKQTGIDAYVALPETLEELQPVLERIFQDDEDGHHQVLELKSAARGGRLVEALAAAFRLGVTNRWILSARSVLARERKVVDRYLEVLQNDTFLRAAAAPWGKQEIEREG